MDFIVALVLGDMFDDVIWAEVPLAHCIVGMATIILVHTLVSFAESHSTYLNHLVTGKPILVIDHAKIEPHGLNSERTNEEELWSQLRINGQDDLQEVREAYWESSGHISILPVEAAEVVQKQDLPLVKERIPSKISGSP